MFDVDIARTIRQLIIILPGFLLAITFHEAAHGYVAYKLGDPTAKNAGRLTLNPLKHLDPIGTLVLVLTRMIGWAKPVPIDPRYFRNYRQGTMLVSAAGPVTNLLLAVALAMLFRLTAAQLASPDPLVGENLLLPLALILRAGMTINLALCFFNLLPIPPLDGSGIVAGLLPPRLSYQYEQFGRWGMILIILLAMTGFLGRLIIPPIEFVTQLLL